MKSLFNFENHVVASHTLDELGSGIVIEQLVWKRPDSIMGMLRYTMINATLAIDGDFGCAVFKWHPDVHLPLKYVATYNLDYISEKCGCSEVGRHFHQWSKAEADREILRFRNEEMTDELKENFDKVWAEHLDESSTESAGQWADALNAHFFGLFGFPVCDLYDVGYVPHDRFQIMHQGLVLAVEWERARKEFQVL